MTFSKSSRSLEREFQVLYDYEKKQLCRLFWKIEYWALEPIAQRWSREMKSSKIYQHFINFWSFWLNFYIAATDKRQWKFQKEKRIIKKEIKTLQFSFLHAKYEHLSVG